MPNYEIIRYSPTNQVRWISKYFETRNNRVLYQNKRIYLQSPELTLEEIEGDWLYLTLTDEQQSFVKNLNSLYQIFRVSNASDHGLLRTLRDYRPIMVSNFLSQTQGLLLQWNQTEIYDHDHLMISRDSLQVGQQVIALILIDQIDTHGLHLHLKQLQINLKPHFEKCLLSDEEIDEPI